MLLLASLILHLDTAIILSFMFLPIFTTRKLYDKVYINGLYLLLLVIVLAIFDKVIDVFRPDFLSELNMVRVIFGFFIPSLLYVIYSYTNKRLTEIRNDKSAIAVHLLNVSICIAVALNFTSSTGEVIVRIATLSSIVSIFLISKRESKKSFYFSIYILLVNSLFFLNTVKSVI
tara:strand:- start:2988 stop:3509 length:522 start_codon:yes stop_codon:yes gene_type:complete